MRNYPLSALFLSLLAFGGCKQAAPSALSVDDAWARLPVVQGRPAAAYFTVKAGPVPDRLVAIESTKAGSIELHEGGMRNGVARMTRIDGVDVPARSTVAFVPGGNHAMLFDLDPAVKPGDRLPLRFRFRSGKTIDTWANTAAAGDAGPGVEHAGH